MFAFMAAYSGAAAWVLAPGHRRLRWGAIAGFLMIATLVLVGLTFQIATGTLEVAPGETVFSTLIELPFWVALVGIPCAVVSAVAWLVVRLIADASAKLRAH